MNNNAPLKGMPAWPGLGSVTWSRPARRSLFAWIRKVLGITGPNTLHDRHVELMGELQRLNVLVHEIQEQLNAIQIDKLKVYVQKQADKPKIADLMRVMDLDTEQLAALEEFKDEK